MRSLPGGPQWRGWDQTSSGRVGLATSARLGGDAPVQNRLFPKVRSWFALGAPLELLSPLSVIRIVLLVLIGGTLALAAVGAVADEVVAGVTVLLVAILLVLTRVKELPARPCAALAATATVAVAALLAAHGGPTALLLLAPVAIFVGLFLSWRALLTIQALTTASVATAGAVAGLATGEITVLVIVTTVATAVTAATVALTAASARGKATVDADTGIPNGYGFAAALAPHLRSSDVAVAVIDLGGLNEAREALGHRAATELLRRAVEDLGQVLPTGATIGRVDGDRLAVAQGIAPDADADLDACDLAVHLDAGLGAGRYLVDGIEIILRPYIGVAVGPADSDDPTELIRRASLAADRARATGHPSTRWADSMVGAMTGADLALLADLRLAPDRGELWMAYQPQIDPTTGATAAVEALLRWSSPVHGVVPPDRFIPLAERTGLVDRLTDWVLDETLDAQVRWRRVGLDLPVSVNVSAGSLSDPRFPHKVMRALAARRLPGEILTVEVTETAALDAEQAVDRLGTLHDAGIGISIDDFGTGYTSLAVLPQLPVDELKVDQRFVKASATSAADDAIVRSVLELAHQLGMRAVAEGVEDEETHHRLRGYGFELLQGWAFSKALPEGALIDFVCTDPHAARSLTTSGRARVQQARHEIEVVEPG